MTAITLQVPSIGCDACAEKITAGILTHESNAKVKVDVSAKTVSVETEASEESIREMIVAVGHTVD
ncbi:MAG: heavy-metal-associated domain-containing protein [Symploca sp. SIO2E9]|nr:heavy-metal-associated domain-containing protein [Symploca sp. SIO2E9]